MKIIYMHEDNAPKHNLTIYSYVVELQESLYSAVVVTIKDNDPVDVCFTGRDTNKVVAKCVALADWALNHYAWEE